MAGDCTECAKSQRKVLKRNTRPGLFVILVLVAAIAIKLRRAMDSVIGLDTNYTEPEIKTFMQIHY